MNDRATIRGARAAFCLLFVAGSISNSLSSATALAQQTGGPASNTSTIAGMRQVLPVVPLSPPRANEGELVGQRWQPVVEQPPIAEFIDSLRASDAAMEVVLGQGRLLTTKGDIATEDGMASVAVGDPTVLEFEILPNPRMIRLLGRRPGNTDLSITTSQGETYTFDVRVVYDLELLSAHLRQTFPDALIKVAQLREHLVVEGQARSATQIYDIVNMLERYLESVVVSSQMEATRPNEDLPMYPGPPVASGPAEGLEDMAAAADAMADELAPELLGESGERPDSEVSIPGPKVINLLRVVGVQQVMLKVRIAELNRTAFREIGADLLFVDPGTGNIVGTALGAAAVSGGGIAALGGLLGGAEAATTAGSTAFGIFPSGDWQIILRVLRQNNVAKILAEPNLVTLSGHNASFLAGGEFPIPVPQSSSAGGAIFTIVFKEFGVRLDFLPFVIDEDQIRLTVTPEVSNIDRALSVTTGEVGTAVPGLNTRRTSTTVQLGQGQTLALAGLLQVEMEARTSRIPGLGDLPYIGPFFSNTESRRVEKELMIMVTPYLVEATDACNQVPLPGEDVMDPNDLEFYLMNRIEGRVGRPFRPTVEYEFCRPRMQIEYEKEYLYGPVGFSQ